MRDHCFTECMVKMILKNCNLFNLPTEHLGVVKNSFMMCPCVPDRIGIWKCWFLITSRSKGENSNQQQTHWSGGECCHPALRHTAFVVYNSCKAFDQELHMKCSMMCYTLNILCMSCLLNDFHKNCSFIHGSPASSSSQCFVFTRR